MQTRFFSLRGETSYPYLSGYTWGFFSDWQMLNADAGSGPVRFNAETAKTGDTIFLDRACLEDFAKRILPRIQGKVILITSNYGFQADYPLPGPFDYILEDEKVAAWFVQNIDRDSTEKLIPIPIGIASKCWKHGNTDLFDRHIPISLAKSSKSIFCYLNCTPRPERMDCMNYFSSIGSTFTKRATFEEYLNDLSESVFVVSPPGTGVDCHRTWEALLMGCYPIVKSSKLNPLYEGLPVVIIEDWREVTDSFLQDKYRELNRQTWPRDKLYAPYWFQKVKEVQTILCPS